MSERRSIQISSTHTPFLINSCPLAADNDLEQGVEYHIGKFSNADISDFSVSRRVYRVEPPISSVFDKLGEGRSRKPRSEEGVHTAMCDNIDTRRVLETLERRCEGHGKTGGFDRDLENILNALKSFFAGQGN